MAKHELFVSIPSYFRCPISMEVMKSPVSLSTGITYDRSSIQAWLDGGHSTCPATMLPLSSPSFVPNLTLHRLIHLWSLSHSNIPPPSLSLPSLLAALYAQSESDLYLSLKKILDLGRKYEENRNFLASSGDFQALIVKLVRKFDLISDKIENLELVFLILDSIVSQFDEIKEKIHKMIFDNDLNCLPKFVFVLRKGSIESKVSAARILEKIAIDEKTKRSMIETPGLLNELHNLITSNCETAIEAGLSAIIAIPISRSAKSELVRLGSVRTVVGILCDAGRSDQVVERAMEMLELIATCGEGRSAICDDEKCVVEIVRRLMKVTEKTTEHGVTVLWIVCYRFRDEKVWEKVVKSNGLAKCLLLLQSNCSVIVKQMCRDLVKVLRVDLKPCLASYDTKTTHIMPY